MLGNEQEGWETPQLIGDGRLKWGASAPIPHEIFPNGKPETAAFFLLS